MSTIAPKSVQLPNGLTLPYAESGYPGGQPVVFVHGLGESWRAFEPVLSRLPVSVQGFAPTQRGHRDTEGASEGHRPEDYAADLVAFLEVLELGRVILVGAGSGGIAARMVAAAYPDRVAGLLMVGSPASLADKPQAPRLVQSVEALDDPVDTAGVSPLLLGGAGPEAAPETYLDTLTEDARHVSATVWRESVFGLVETDLRATLAGILVPTLAIRGDGDGVVPAEDHDVITDTVFGARTALYEGVGHVVHQEVPDRFTREVVAFSASITEPARS